jgi:hypothetical protein
MLLRIVGAFMEPTAKAVAADAGLGSIDLERWRGARQPGTRICFM